MSAPTSLTTWRTHPYSADLYLGVYAPPVVFSALVNQATFTYPIAQVTYDTVTVGAFTDIVVGQTVRVKRSGKVVWKGRIRKTPTSTILYFGRVSEGEITFADNDVIEVVDDFEIWTKVPQLDENNKVVYKDHDLAFTADYGNKPNPICVAGPHRIGFVDPTISSKFRVAFDLTGSYGVSDTAGTLTYSANLKDGTIFSGTVASGVFTVDFPAGKRWVFFTVTDADGKTHTRRVFVWAANRTGAHAPMRVRATRLTSDLQTGPTMYAQVLEDDLSTVVEGALCLLFVEERYGGTLGSISGYAGSEQVKFVGYIDRESVEITPDNNNFNLTAVSPLAIADRGTAFSLTLQNKSSASKWHHMKTLSAFKFIWHLLTWHSTLTDVCDLVKPEWQTSYAVKRLDAQFGTLRSQIMFAAHGVAARFTADRQGRLWLRRDLQLASDANRNAAITTVELQEGDWADVVTFDRETRDRYYWLRGSAIKAGTTPSALLSIAPGKSPSQAGQETTLDRQLVTDQTELNVRTGRQFKLLNSRIPRLSLTSAHGGSIVDPGWQEWVKFNLATSTNKRQYSFSSTRFICIEHEWLIDNDRGVVRERMTLEQEAVGVDGIKLRVPTSDLTNTALTPPPPFRPITTTYATYKPVKTGDQHAVDLSAAPAVFIVTPTVIGRTKNPNGSTPNYIKLADASVDFGGFNIRRTILDPWYPKYRMYVLGTLSDTVKVWEVLDIMTDVVTVREIFSYTEPNTIGGAHVVASINVPGMLFICWSEGGGTFNARITRRTSYTAAFDANDTLQSGSVGPENASISCGPEHYLTSTTDGYVYSLGFRTTSPTPSITRVFRSINGGQTWAELTGGVEGTTGGLLVPYNGGENGQTVFTWGKVSGGNLHASQFVITKFVDTARTAIAPFDGVSQYYGAHGSASWQAAMSFHVYTNDINELALVSGTKMFRSSNGGTSWSEITLPTGVTSSVYGIGGWPNNKDIFFIWGHDLSSGIYYVSVPNPTAGDWKNIIGDWATAIGTFTGAVQVIPITVI